MFLVIFCCKMSRKCGGDGSCFEQNDDGGYDYYNQDECSYNCVLVPCWICQCFYPKWLANLKGEGWCMSCDMTICFNTEITPQLLKERYGNIRYCQLCFEVKQTIGDRIDRELRIFSDCRIDNLDLRNYHKSCWKQLKISAGM